MQSTSGREKISLKVTYPPWNRKLHCISCDHNTVPLNFRQGSKLVTKFDFRCVYALKASAVGCTVGTKSSWTVGSEKNLNIFAAWYLDFPPALVQVNSTELFCFTG